MDSKSPMSFDVGLLFVSKKTLRGTLLRRVIDETLLDLFFKV